MCVRRKFLLFISIFIGCIIIACIIIAACRNFNHTKHPPPQKPQPSTSPSLPPQKPKQSPPRPQISPPPSKPPQPPPPAFESPRLALVYPVIQAFKKKVTFDPKEVTKTWTGTNICRDYKGFFCDIVPHYNQIALSGVDFNHFYLGGRNLTITDLLSGLPDIVFFHANSNNFTGSFPTDLNKLKYFYELDLSNNKFSGEFPYRVLRATKLKFLDLRFNAFAGVVPPQFLRLNLDFLLINNNNFAKKLPENLGSTTANYVTVANNEFVGGIPPSIGQASDTLFEVLFLNNWLSGCLPYEIGLLKKAYVFDVESNYLTGSIPHSFQCLKKMQVLNLARNNFYGVVPEMVCSLPELFSFTLAYNYFTEVGPRCRELIKNGVLDVKKNCIVDLPDQRSSADCANFFSRSHSCPNETSLTYVPCTQVYSSAQLESSDVHLTAPAPAPTQPPRWLTYDALSASYVISSRHTHYYM
ncbi:hypothetical protein QVD17_30257 [Tagetes erecta]|uniref:Uncharacterized protein n=1 Tax=Tagetes erecta TaxID=13708 RepID=A0AAD8NN33_TARER|nr:hypothetical protein QVD17_30257 [Tagetes erecta]